MDVCRMFKLISLVYVSHAFDTQHVGYVIYIGGKYWLIVDVLCI